MTESEKATFSWSEDGYFAVRMLVFGIFVCAIMLAQIYFPVRLYYIGEIQKDLIADTRYVNYHDTFDGSAQYTVLTGQNTGHEVQISGESQMKIGDTIQILGNHHLGKSMYIDVDKPTLTYVISHYDISSDGILNFIIVSICVLIVALVIFYKVFRLIKIEIKEKLTPNDTSVEKFGAYIKNFLPIISLLVFCYALTLVMIKAALYIEDQWDLIVGLVLLFFLVFILVCPLLILKLSRILKKSKNIRLRNVRMIFSTILSICFSIKTLEFFMENNFGKHETIKRLITDILKSFFTV